MFFKSFYCDSIFLGIENTNLHRYFVKGVVMHLDYKKIISSFLLLCLYSVFLFAQDGVSDTAIRLGQSCALSGPAAALGKELKSGADAYFKKINSKGGVHGRKIILISLDDGYEPEQTLTNTRRLVSIEKVFALFGYVGTPTIKAIINIVDNTDIPLVGPYTGAGFLRIPDRNVFNIRGTYDQETAGLVNAFTNMNKPRIAVFFQNDAYGKVGLAGVKKALAKTGMSLTGFASYERNTVNVSHAVKKFKKMKPDAIIMIGAYKPCAEFIKQASAAGIQTEYANISFVGTAKLIEELGSDGEGTFISQVVPSPFDTSISLVKECEESLGHKPTYGELEGYLDAKVMVAALEAAGKDLSRENFVQAFESMHSYNAGGVVVSYGPGDHQGMDKIFYTVIKGGKAVPVWNKD